MPRQWRILLAIEWTPMIAFMRKRLKLTDWLDEHTSPQAFIDEADHVGVALGDLDTRAVISRERMIITASSTEALPSLRPVVDAVFTVMEPKLPGLAHSRVTLTHPLTGSYTELIADFAHRAGLSNAVLPPGVHAVDSSVLTDMRDDARRVQIEWGVVNRNELFDRVSDWSFGRLSSPGADLSTGPRALSAFGKPADVSEVSLLTDVSMYGEPPIDITDSEHLFSTAENEVRHASAIGTAVADGIKSQGGEHSDHAFVR